MSSNLDYSPGSTVPTGLAPVESEIERPTATETERSRRPGRASGELRANLAPSRLSLATLARLCRLLTATVVILVLLHTLQGAIEMISVLVPHERRQEAVRPGMAQFTDQEKSVLRVMQASKAFRPDGTLDVIPRIQTCDPVRKPVEQLISVLSPDGELVWEGERQHMPFEHLEFSHYMIGYDRSQRLFARPRWTPAPAETVEFPVAAGDGKTEIWRYDTRVRRFRGFRLQGKPVGYLGRNGFSMQPEKAKPFETCIGAGEFLRGKIRNGLILWVTQNGAYRLDFLKREVETLAEGRVDIQLLNWSATSQSGTPVTGKRAMVIRVSPTVYDVIEPRTRTDYRLEFPETGDGRKPAPFMFALRDDILYAARYSYPAGSDGTRKIAELFRVDGQRRPVLVARHELVYDASLYPRLHVQHQHPARAAALVAVLQPLPYGIVTRAVLQHCRQNPDQRRSLVSLFHPPRPGFGHGTRPGWQQRWLGSVMRNSLPVGPPALATACLLAVVLLVIRRRRTPWQRSLVWAVWTLLFNLGGFLACVITRQREPRRVQRG